MAMTAYRAADPIRCADPARGGFLPSCTRDLL